MPAHANAPIARRILAALFALRAANALPLTESAPGRNIWRFGFRAAGHAVSIDIDVTVASLRCYHGRDEVAMSPLSPGDVAALLGKAPPPADVKRVSEAEAMAELRAAVAAWRDGNPRLAMRPPAVVGHPDNWNRA